VTPIPSYQFGPFLLQEGVLYRDGRRVGLTPKAVELLQVLVAGGGKIVPKEELIKAVWPDTFVDDSSLTSNISILRKTLGSSPSGQAYIETIPKRGYRLITAVEQPGPESSTAGATAELPQPPRRISRSWIPAICVAVVFAAILVCLEFSPKEPAKRIMVAVLPVQNLTGDAAKEYLADGLTEEFIAQLSRFNPERLAVIARTSSMAYKTTGKTAQQIGQELNADYLVESSMRESNGTVRVTVQLVRARDQIHIWSAEYNRTMANLFSLQDEIAQAIALQVRVQVMQASQTRSEATRPLNPDAYFAYLRGRFYWNQRTPQDLEQAILQFQAAIQFDPNYALAYSGLADAYSSQCLIADVSSAEVFPKAKAAALKALQLDGGLAEAHNSLAYVLFWNDWDWNAAETEFKRALDLNPGYAMAHQWYSMFLALMGREQEAIAESQKALALDPVSRIINMETGLPYFFLHRFDEAIPRFQRALELDPNFSLARCDLAWAYLGKGDTQDAIMELEKAVQSNKSAAILSTLGSAYADAGRRADAEEIVQQLRERATQRYVSPFFLATIYIPLNEKELALDALEQAYANHDWVIVWIHVGVRLDPLRSSSRFQALVHKLNFPDNPPGP
jgi:TolB-like protein/DNA-binding winged helix-turn-helix (wHTH) protein/Tfp pilus assembly protein PilF